MRGRVVECLPMVLYIIFYILVLWEGKARLLYVIALQSYRTARYFHKPTLPPTVRHGTRVVKVWVPVPYRNLHFRFVLQVGREELEMDL